MKREEYSEEFKQGHVRAWEASGQSQQSYCKSQGLVKRTFSNWTRRYKEGMSTSVIGQGMFLEVHGEEGYKPLENEAVKIRYANGTEISIPLSVASLGFVQQLISLYP